jgi:HK97 family phage portal protein
MRMSAYDLRVRWWRSWLRRRVERSGAYSISDPRLAELFASAWAPNYSGVEVTESTALTLSAVFRAVALIAGTVASLPMNTIRETDVGRMQIRSFLDDPGGRYGPTPFGWKETMLCHLVLHGDAFLAHVQNAIGALVSLEAIHPLAVAVRWSTKQERESGEVVGPKVYTATLCDGATMRFDARSMTQISYLSLDGLRGLSPIAIARNSLGTAIAGDRAAAKMFNSGALISGVLVPAEGEDVDADEAKIIKAEVTRNAGGWENASEIAVVNRRMDFKPWTMSADDLQFIQSRQFQIEEIARWFGVPPHLLMQTEKQTSWGQGVESQNRAMGRTVLLPWTIRIEEALSRLLPRPQWVEFDFAGLERPTPEAEIGLLIQQVQAGLLTINEARHRQNMPPLPGGDVLRIGGQPIIIEGQLAQVVPPSLSPADVQALNASAGPPVTNGRADTAAHTGAMVALLPSEADAARLAVDGGEPVDQLHLTLQYLGEAAAIPAEARALLVDQVAAIAAAHGPLEVDGFAVSMFNPAGPEPCVVLGATGPGLDTIHSAVAAAVSVWAEACAQALPDQHAPWVPHVTLQYTADVEQLAALVDRVGPIVFDRIRVVFADEATDVALTAMEMAAA